VYVTCQAALETKEELDRLQDEYEKVMANEDAQRMLAEAAGEVEGIDAVDDSQLNQSLGTMSLEEEKRKRRTIQLQVLMRESHKVAAQNRQQRVAA